MNWLNRAQWNTKEIAAYHSIKNGMPFKDLPDKKQDIFLFGTLAKISVVSGCPLPTQKDQLDILKTEMKKFITENKSFSTMTAEEIVTAFRFNASGSLEERVEHWQKVFNLDYLGKVLSQWCKIRQKITLKADLEQMKMNIYEPELEEISSNSEAFEYAKKIWNTTNDYLFIRSAAYNHLIKTGKLVISNERKKEIKALASEKLNEILNDHRYLEIFKLAFFNSEFETFLIHKISKKIAVAEYFEKEYAISKSNQKRK